VGWINPTPLIFIKIEILLNILLLTFKTF